MKKFLENLQESEKELKIVGHMLYVTFPLVRERNILIKSLLKIKKIIMDCLNLILQYEYINGKLVLSNDSVKNFLLFKEKCSEKYSITQEEVKEIELLFDLAKSHRKSPMEFIKDGKVIILSDNMLKKTFNLEDLKRFLGLAKKIMERTKEEFMRNSPF